MLSTSLTALSPSRLKSMSPGLISSPSCFSQATKTPSSIFQPRRGMVISTAIGLLRHQGADRRDDLIRLWDDSGLQRRAIRRRCVDSVEAADGRVEVIEAEIGDTGGDLRADAVG